MKTLYRIPLLAIIALIALSPGCGHLDPAGVYKTDKVLYGADLAIGLSKAQLDTFLKWELNNRVLLAKAGNKEATKIANNIRVRAPLWYRTAIIARDEYAANPNSQTSSALTTAISVLHIAVAQTIAAMSDKTAGITK